MEKPSILWPGAQTFSLRTFVKNANQYDFKAVGTRLNFKTSFKYVDSLCYRILCGVFWRKTISKTSQLINYFTLQMENTHQITFTKSKHWMYRVCGTVCVSWNWKNDFWISNYFSLLLLWSIEIWLCVCQKLRFVHKSKFEEKPLLLRSQNNLFRKSPIFHRCQWNSLWL